MTTTTAPGPDDAPFWLRPGVTVARNTSGKREPVLTEGQWRKISGSGDGTR